MTIKLFSPLIEQEAISNIIDALNSDWISSGPYVKQLEKDFPSGLEYNIALNSCTAALHLASILLDIQPGDEVIVPSLTFVASIVGILHRGGIPVIVDVDPDTLLISEDIVKKSITKKTKAIIAVHYAGRIIDLDSWSINIPIIEDCAQAMGGLLPKRTDTLRCFSFHAVKNLTGGVGGMLSTSSSTFAERTKALRWVGIQRDTFDRSHGSYVSEYDITEIGYNYYMCNLNAAIILGQMKHFQEHQETRAIVAEYYYKNLNTSMLHENYANSANYIFPIHISDRLEFMKYMTSHNIETGIHHQPLHTFPIIRKYSFINDVSFIDDHWKQLVSIPLHCKLQKNEIESIVRVINQW